ncbi:Uncharacterised protein [Vibrio cholerae]|uniref:Uncharacterized protein n=1 Tax=Vibrio cholerae TaxID=666 RepID=A0A655ZJ66_VIBCL|nr:Uncharacterised protein [Vibrio cholerae]
MFELRGSNIAVLVIHPQRFIHFLVLVKILFGKFHAFAREHQLHPFKSIEMKQGLVSVK